MYTVPIPECRFTEQTRAGIGEAIYLLGYLIQRANWETGVTLVTQSGISQATGFPLRTVERWMQALRAAGLISTRRTCSGTLVTIHGFEPVAKTHRVKYRPPANPPQPAEGHSGDPPLPASDAAERRPTDPPRAAPDTARFGLSNIKEILSPNRISFAQTFSSLCSEEGNAPADATGQDRPRSRPKRRCWENGYEDPDLAEAIEALSHLSVEERDALGKQAMERMEISERRFLRFLVQRNEQGNLEPAGEQGERTVVLEMAQLLPNATES